MIIRHEQIGDMSATEIDFGDCTPTDEEVRRVREILGLRDADPASEE